jgi:polyketide synthase PksN
MTGFRELYEATDDNHIEVSKPHCGIGTVKTNIGHLELAAGAAGVIKVLLQLKHKKLVKSLHGEEQNPYIDLKGSPFYLVQENQEWPVLNNNKGEALPRLAGVSSFGAGGSNAHVIIEEYIPHISTLNRQKSEINKANPALVVLSAKNEDRLKEYAQKLLVFLQQNHEIQESSFHLEDLAYTLQVGREAMEERMGMIVSSLEELEEKLMKYSAGESHLENLYLGKVKKNKDTISAFETDDELKKAVDKWIKNRKFSKLLEFWTKGLNIDWSKLYNEQKPRKVSLPTYPFAKERYWVGETETNLLNLSEEAQARYKEQKEVVAIEDKTFRKPEKPEEIETLYFETILEKKPLSIKLESTKQASKTMICFLSDSDQRLSFSSSLKNSF